MSRSKTKSMARLSAAVVAATAFGTVLGGCSDIYYDRRETLALGGGDAVAANAITQMVDPWPAHSGNNNLTANGQKMQSAIERYRNNKVTPPINPTTSEVQLQQQSQAAAATTGGTSSNGTAPTGTGSPTITTTTSAQ